MPYGAVLQKYLQYTQEEVPLIGYLFHKNPQIVTLGVLCCHANHLALPIGIMAYAIICFKYTFFW